MKKLKSFGRSNAGKERETGTPKPPGGVKSAPQSPRDGENVDYTRRSKKKTSSKEVESLLKVMTTTIEGRESALTDVV